MQTDTKLFDISHLDAEDQVILRARFEKREQKEGPRIGDFVRFTSGEIERFRIDCKWGMLTDSPEESLVRLEWLQLTETTMQGDFWFFPCGIASGDSGVRFQMPCRVYDIKN